LLNDKFGFNAKGQEMKITFFKTPKPKQFSYKPRYYDEKKEALENLKKKYSEQKDDGGVSPEFRDKLKSTLKMKDKRTGAITGTTLLIYLALVALLLYYIFFS
jgi:hypothetical protein